MTKMAEPLAKFPVSESSSTVNATAQTRQIAGASCAVHDVKVSRADADGQRQRVDRHEPGRIAW